MKRKELMKRALSLALCAMMTVGNLPSVTYASDLSPTDTGVVSQADGTSKKMIIYLTLPAVLLHHLEGFPSQDRRSIPRSKSL